MRERRTALGSNPQQSHYEQIHDAYEAHYYDDSSMNYRRRFMYGPLIQGMDFRGASVADLACGSGHNSLALLELFDDIKCTGYDISEKACADYRVRLQRPAFQVDLTAPYDPPELHDAAFVIGGLHHCVIDLEATLRNIARMVRPGGSFLMMEPNEEFFLSFLRRLWYRNDKWFDAESERALVHDELAKIARHWFTPEKVSYFGGPAFYLILNSLITRVPLHAKPTLAAITFPVESAYNLLPGRSPFAAFLAQWRRNDVPA